MVWSDYFAAAVVALLHWSVPSGWLAALPLSTRSVAVVYAAMLELGFHQPILIRVSLPARAAFAAFDTCTRDTLCVLHSSASGGRIAWIDKAAGQCSCAVDNGSVRK